jgi:hypothetical protein
LPVWKYPWDSNADGVETRFAVNADAEPVVEKIERKGENSYRSVFVLGRVPLNVDAFRE